ncbi:peptidase S41 [Flavobacteriaceae bacterium Ap0902]|nr:peptidase S41 [Flavobacteriaceae bacterium Ap0902]
MNKLNGLLILICSLILLGCNDDDINEYEGDELYITVNDFIWKGLNSWYFWNTEIPALADDAFASNQAYVDFLKSQNPENLFYGLLNDYPNIDRFSWMVDDVDQLLMQFSGITVTSGMDYTLVYLNEEMGTVIGMVNYVVPNSPAHLQGIERGDLILGVNSQPLTVNNYTMLASNSFTMTIGRNPVLSNGEIFIENQIEVAVDANEIAENPVHFHQIIEEGNHRIGYLVYNGYRANYNDELNAVFADFKTAGVSDLILDLRYNSGGALNSAVGLAQMITGQFTNSPFVISEYNEKHTRFNEVYNFSEELPIYDFIEGQNVDVGTESINSLGLNRIYVLTSNGTASASELTILGLKDYIEVIQIGGRTRGKFMGSITLFDDEASDFRDYNNRNRNHAYAMQPLVFAYYNASHENHNQGLNPLYEYNFADYIGMGAFGQTTDPAYAQALSLITGYNYKESYHKASNFSTRFLGTSKTLQRFGSELYIEPQTMLR